MNTVNTTYVVGIAVALVVVLVGALIWRAASRRKRSARLHGEFGAEYDRAVLTAGGERKAQRELEGRRKHVDALEIRPLSGVERERYRAGWTSVQSKFVDAPGPAIGDADRLIMEVMRLRAYPVSEYEQRAADISVSYPAFVGNYRAAREIAIKNERGQASTEELRQALIHYRSVFEELVGTEVVVEDGRGARLVPVLGQPVSTPSAR